MRRLLEHANVDLLNQSKLLIELLDDAPAIHLLSPYKTRVRELCTQMASDAQRNLDDLKHDLPSTFEAILSNTQAVACYLDLVGGRFTGPILRRRPDDDIMLAVLHWLHASHLKTRAHPFAFGDGGFSVYNDLSFPAIYLLPAPRQSTLLYVPLFLHEFGHVLYRFFKPEMDELVKEFQQVVSAHAAPTTIRDRRVAGQEEEFRSLLVLAWYSWMQEFFCDAVGVTMGGPAYLKAFSHYLRLRSTEQYYRPRKEQLRSRHPVALLRIKMLADRARLMGLGVLADEVEGEWALCAKLMKVTEDYEGVWADEFFIPLRDRLSDMLEETGPLRWQPYVPGTIANPTQVCELAWSKFEDSPQQYRAWEIETVNEIRRNLLSGKIFGVDCTPA